MNDYRLIFLFFIIAVFILYRIRTKTSFFGGLFNRQAFLSVLLAFALVGAISSFFIMMFDYNPEPLIRWVGYQVGRQQLVNFAESVPPYLGDNYAVKDVSRTDLDGDGFNEWLVMYQYDARGENTPLSAVVYDNDQGSPPVIYPYPLMTPNGDYLSEGDYQIDYENVTDNEDAAGNHLDDLLIWGYAELPFGIPAGARRNKLTIFRHQSQAKEPWDQPTNNPPRYVPVGHFAGDGDIDYDSTNKEVTVINRGEYERSQLGMYKVYRLNQEGKSFYDSTNPAVLDQPTIQTINFFPEPPTNITNASYPEQIVLAFYASMCTQEGKDLCSHADKWNKSDFLKPDSEAFERYRATEPGYFGLSSFNVAGLEVEEIYFQPENPGQTSLVTIKFTAGGEATNIATLHLENNDGIWKITRAFDVQQAMLGME